MQQSRSIDQVQCIVYDWIIGAFTSCIALMLKLVTVVYSVAPKYIYLSEMCRILHNDFWHL